MRSLLAILPLHFVVYLGLFLNGATDSQKLGALGPGILGYPVHFVRMLTGGDLITFLGGFRVSGIYLLISVLLMWPLILALKKMPTEGLWVLGSFPAFFLMSCLVFLAFYASRIFGFFTPVDGAQPWVIFCMAISLAVPSASRIAEYLQSRTKEYISADFSRTAIAFGFSAQQAAARAGRVAMPEGILLLGGEVLALATSLLMLEGLLQIPGVGLMTYNILASAGNVDGYVAGIVQSPLETASSGIFLLLMLAGLFSELARFLSNRLDPRQ